MRGRCRLGFPVLLAMSCVVQTAHAAPIPRCAVIDRGTLPEPANCQRRFGAAAAATPDALHALADTQMKIGHYGEASAALGCAATQLVDSDDMTRRYEWIRRRGVLAYRQEHIADALGHFECALAMAEARGDRAATAKQLKNVGSALRRIGDYGNALRMLERGVQLMRADGDPAVGGMLANIADVYRETGKPQQAERYYREAEEAFRRKGDVVEAAHVLDSLSDAKTMADQTGIGYRWVRDTDGELLVAAQANGLPDTLLIDTDGTVLATKLGAFTSQKDIEQWIASNL